MKKLILKAIQQNTTDSITIQKIVNTTRLPPKKIKDTIEQLRQIINKIAKDNNVSVEEVIKNQDRHNLLINQLT